MPMYCHDNSHTWTTQTRSTTLTPALDLVPGRRCICGCYVIIDPEPRQVPRGSFNVAAIDSIAAQSFAQRCPALKTW